MVATHDAPRVRRWLRTSLRWAGLYDRTLPASYADGADVPDRLAVPVVPPAPAATLPGFDPIGEAQAAMAAGAGHASLDDLAYLPLTRENLEAVLDERVRPALHADGGDIALVDLRGHDVYVKLVGACSSCPSSVMTLRMGIERMLQDEFPDMGELVQVDGLLL